MPAILDLSSELRQEIFLYAILASACPAPTDAEIQLRARAESGHHKPSASFVSVGPVTPQDTPEIFLPILLTCRRFYYDLRDLIKPGGVFTQASGLHSRNLTYELDVLLKDSLDHDGGASFDLMDLRTKQTHAFLTWTRVPWVQPRVDELTVRVRMSADSYLYRWRRFASLNIQCGHVSGDSTTGDVIDGLLHTLKEVIGPSDSELWATIFEEDPDRFLFVRRLIIDFVVPDEDLARGRDFGRSLAGNPCRNALDEHYHSHTFDEHNQVSRCYQPMHAVWLDEKLDFDDPSVCLANKDCLPSAWALARWFYNTGVSPNTNRSIAGTKSIEEDLIIKVNGRMVARADFAAMRWRRHHEGEEGSELDDTSDYSPPDSPNDWNVGWYPQPLPDMTGMAISHLGPWPWNGFPGGGGDDDEDDDE